MKLEAKEVRAHAQTVQMLEKSMRIDNGEVPLAPNTSYTSAKLECEFWGWVIGTCYADVRGSLKCQFSEDDGAHWDGEHDPITYVANDKLAFAFEVAGHWSRLVFTNGNQPQTVFRLHIQLRRAS